jgi:hypothetical protein
VIAIELLLTLLAHVQVATQDLGSTLFNIAHRLPMARRHLLSVFSSILSPIRLKYGGQLTHGKLAIN